MSKRLLELADRLIASGPKAAHVSASECHEITEGIHALVTERDRWQTAFEGQEARYKGRPLMFCERAAIALADEVAVLVRRDVIDSRSPAADALLDFRDPPSSPRADRLAALETRRDELLALVAKLSQETPLPSELEGWEGQRAALMAEIGTLRATIAEMQRTQAAEQAQIGAEISMLSDAVLGLIEDLSAAHDAIRRARREITSIGGGMHPLSREAKAVAQLIGQLTEATREADRLRATEQRNRPAALDRIDARKP